MSGFSLAALKNTLDEVRVSVYAKNETEKKVYEALSSKNWGASSTMLNDIAADSSDYEKFGIINEILWASMETEGKSWKQIFKSLTLVEFLIKNGSERFIEAARDKLFKIKRLQDYNYYEGTVDKGSGCREKAKQIVELLSSNDIIRSEREKARALRNKFGGVGSDSARGGGGGSYGGSYSGNSDSYGNHGPESRDRPSVGSGGRYSGDSYGNDRSSNDKNNYNDKNSYNDRDNKGGSNTGRYGGGAYDSDKPPRYGDDTPADRSNDRNNEDVDDIKPYKPASKDNSNTATGSKLKVSIRKSVVAETTAAAAPAPKAAEVNLMGDDFEAFSSAPAPAAPSASAAFDPFMMSGPAAPAPAAPVAAAFDPFGASAPTPAPAAAAFDPFGAPAASAAFAPTSAHFDPFNQPQGFAHNQPAFAPQQQTFAPQQGYNAAPTPAFQQQGFPQHAPQQQQQQYQQAPPQQQQLHQQYQQAPSQQQQQYRAGLPSSSSDADFGDFEAAKPSASAKPAMANKWGDLGSLVDLGGISKNASPPAKNEGNNGSNAAYAPSSFAGLGDFNKTPQSMQAGARPMGGGGYMSGGPAMAPRGAPMMPAAMGAQPMMGGYGAQPMGYGAPAAAAMGAYGAPNPNMGGYGAPAPYMGGAYGGPPPAMGYGAPMMGGAPVGGMNMGMPAPGYPPQQAYRPAGSGGFGAF